MLRIATLMFASLNLLCLGFASLGRWIPAADSAALLWPLFVAGTAVGVLSTSAWRIRLLFAGAAIAASATLLPALYKPSREADLRIYSKNLWASNDQTKAIADDIRKTNADLVALQEITSRNADILDSLREDYPYQLRCLQHRGHVALLSRSAFTAQRPCETSLLVAARVRAAGNEVWVASVHVPWHWPIESENAERRLADQLRALPGAVVVAGDFNSFPWTHRMSKLRRASRTRQSGPLMATYSQARIAFPLMIDHVLAPGGGRLEKRPLFGSDHHGIVASIDISR